jgi:hypothetical protein
MGTRSNRSAIGARRSIEAEGRRQTADVVSGGNYFSQSSLTLYFGLGDAENVDRIEVRWPSGETQVWKNVAANRTVKLSEGRNPVEAAQRVKPAVEK